jgi:hypothetical protein
MAVETVDLTSPAGQWKKPVRWCRQWGNCPVKKKKGLGLVMAEAEVAVCD